MVSYIISRLVVLVFGTLYPAYASYKAVKTRNVKEYVKWMMYWIVFALFTFVETVADIFASILPFYYEAKILFIFWLISPWTKGSTYLYRKFVHPTLSKREQEIDEYISQASNKGYEALKKVSRDGLTIAANVVMTSAMKGQTTLMDQLKNYSKTASQNAITEEDASTLVEKDGRGLLLSTDDDDDQGLNDQSSNDQSSNDKEYSIPLRARLEANSDTSQDLLDSLDNRLRKDQDNREEYTAEDYETHKDDDDHNDINDANDVEEEEMPLLLNKNRSRPSPRRAVHYHQPTRQEYHMDDPEYLPETDFGFRRSPSLRSLRQVAAKDTMSRSHYASAENLSRQQTRRKQQPKETTSTERQQGRYPLRTSTIKMTRY